MVLWVAFWLTAVLTWVADSTLWMKEWYYIALSALGIVSLLIGVGIMAAKGRTRRSVILVVLGLVIGQWWLIEMLVVQTIWSIRGFAP